jgi:hypothetical protein
LYNGTCREKGVAADQSAHGRVRLGTACKEECFDQKLWREKKLCLWVEENCVLTEEFL